MWKWWICGILFLATVLNYLDRQTISLCGPMISEEFELSNEQFGRLLSAFRWSYAILQIPAGFIADRFSIRIVLALAVGFWSVAGAAAAFVGSWRTLAATRAALGVGEAFNFPCALRVVANMLPPADRALGNGIFNSGSAFGALIAPAIIIPLAVYFDWRAAFFAVGALGAVWIVIWCVATGNHRLQRSEEIDRGAAGSGTKRVPLGRQLLDMALHPGFWLLVVASAAINPCWFFCADWIPKYMHDQRGFSFAWAGAVTLPVFLFADAGNFFGGGLVKLLTGRGWSIRKARGTAATIGAVLILSAPLVGYVENAFLCIALLVVAAFGITTLMVNYAACVQEVSFLSVGLVSGVLGAFGNLVAATLNPLIGKHVDTTGNYHVIFVLLGVWPLTALVAILTFDAVAARRERITD